ncbi:response regulator transcription factor [Pseudalkalibacillus hwajinpoensis]|uniref:response regulator transcription factor n=1 Tax=Guptibacillus hwajinpoensis TaxID=208199 RepID=UPI001CD20FA3|nr:AraC family transcriptional regulator [Pseudalkalibacillus hwajinpoensis]MCA0990704.1 AraC family transcriptional regulator [Pseudalkalibacillus hwajinpoensis]
MKYKVVIADDEPLILKNLQGIIDWKSLDCEIVAAVKNGRELLEKLQRYSVDLLLTDISMPEMSGVEVLKEIYNWPSPPLSILLSGYDEFSYAREGLKYNALDYFLKPIDYDELENCINKALLTIKERKEHFYEQKKQWVYDQVTSGLEVPMRETRHSYAAIMILHPDSSEGYDLGSLRTYLSGWEWEHFLYPWGEKNFLAVLQFDEEEDAERKVTEFAENGVEVVEDSVWAIGSVVKGMNSCKKSADEAKDLLALASFTDEKVITKELVERIYTPKASVSESVNQAITYIKNHFHEDLSIEQVAEHVGISVSYFSQLFKQKEGITFLEYIRKERVKHACTFLRNSNLETYRIAEKVGYTDQRYFSQVFKKTMSMTPSQYRKQNQKN